MRTRSIIAIALLLGKGANAAKMSQMSTNIYHDDDMLLNFDDEFLQNAEYVTTKELMDEEVDDCQGDDCYSELLDTLDEEPMTWDDFLVEFKEENSAAAAPDCQTNREFDIQFWKLHNMFRTNPKAFVPYLTDLKKRYKPDKTYKTADGVTMMTREGADGIQVLIDFLNAFDEKRTALRWDEDLAKAARLMAKMQGPTGQLGHTGPDGSSMSQRIKKFKNWEATIGENIMYNSQSPMNALMALATDDGQPSRGHRRNIFSDKFVKMGASTMMHKKYKSETVTVYEGAWKHEPYDDFPKIDVPQSVAGYTNYAKWDASPTCTGGAASGGNATAGGSPAANNTTAGKPAAANNTTAGKPAAANNTTAGKPAAANNTTAGKPAAAKNTTAGGGSAAGGANTTEAACTWQDLPNQKKSMFRWIKLNNCNVMSSPPPRPWPKTLRRWKDIKEWGKQNPEAWKQYRKDKKEAQKTAKVYYPFDAAKCRKAGGNKWRHMKVPAKFEVKICPTPYPA